MVQKPQKHFFPLVFVASTSPSCYMFKVSATRMGKQSCSESMQTPSAAAHIAICFIFCGEGSAKTVKNNNQPPPPPPSASHTCHSDRHRHECEFEPPSPPLSSSSILMEIASLNKHSGQETGDTHGTVCLAIVTNQAAA